jgi:curved DNA-binding protein CbpA
LARRYHPDVGAGSSPVEFQRVRKAYEALADPERRRRYDQQLRDSRPEPVVVRQVIVPRPFAEPLVSSRRSSLGAPTIWVTVTRSSFVDELVEELFAFFDDRWFNPPRRW